MTYSYRPHHPFNSIIASVLLTEDTGKPLPAQMSFDMHRFGERRFKQGRLSISSGDDLFELELLGDSAQVQLLQDVWQF